MQHGSYIVSSLKNPIISVQVTAGHFTTNSSHISHYIDMGELKSCVAMAKDAARELAAQYVNTTLIDMVMCMEGTEVVSAYLAEELLRYRSLVMGDVSKMHVITPMTNVSGRLIFHHDVQERISGRNVLLVVSSVSSGTTIHRTMECIDYYGGRVAGISALFSYLPEVGGHGVNALFTCEDIPDYRLFGLHDCVMCRQGRRLDAIISSEGYTKL